MQLNIRAVHPCALPVEPQHSFNANPTDMKDVCGQWYFELEQSRKLGLCIPHGVRCGLPDVPLIVMPGAYIIA